MTRFMMIRFPLPGLNEVLAWKRVLLPAPKSGAGRPDLWSQKKKAYERMIQHFAAVAGFRRPLAAPTWQTVVFFEAGGRDRDNALVGLKLINDALKDLGAFPDDSPAWITGITVHVMRAEKTGALVAFAESSLTLDEAMGLTEGTENGKRNEREEAVQETRQVPGRAGNDTLPAPAGGTRPGNPPARRKAARR